jgi:catechol 2,3-dioxygenase-like lactoylglutathione lyase family enzyme
VYRRYTPNGENKVELRNAEVVTTLPVTDLERAKRFYGDKLGLDLCSENRDRGELVYEAGDGSHILVYQRPTASRSDATTMSFVVDDIRKTAGWLSPRWMASRPPGSRTPTAISSPLPRASWHGASCTASASALPSPNDLRPNQDYRPWEPRAPRAVFLCLALSPMQDRCRPTSSGHGSSDLATSSGRFREKG